MYLYIQYLKKKNIVRLHKEPSHFKENKIDGSVNYLLYDLRSKLLMIFLYGVDLQLISEFQNFFGKFCPVSLFWDTLYIIRTVKSTPKNYYLKGAY